MKVAYLILIIIAICGCKTIEGSGVVGKERTYANQGEFESHLAEQYFSQDYETTKYQKFKGNILKDSLSEYNIVYFDSLRVILDIEDTVYRRVFTEGILSPKNLYYSQSMQICCYKLINLNENGTRRRFRFWVFEEGMGNPLEYYIELTNSEATGQIPLSEFLNKAEVTHISEPRVII
ncbi:hypothetical protein [Pontibacter akesuensis]|uniref:Uncharacterized protein n=1 Tax=Pontibacter akesuensis TaxID=388950 RepID=A0A1I7FFL5_9BACT|nr:hypothetical protein [Pontibacter akesuensis]GHA62367.1 hypothetical protein GCM10007389_13910 [Pontibacter akesuensis]SFU34967.1 hypothetical protein SAMN04487941_0165 [Pontibacter akesuensis]